MTLQQKIEKIKQLEAENDIEGLVRLIVDKIVEVIADL